MRIRPDLTHAPWLAMPALQQVLKVLEAGGGEARVAGGAVRNGLLGEPVDDIDVATDLTPDRVTELCSAAGLAVHPTGLDHGTVTVVAGEGEGRHPFEVTTLRIDTETYGRHAKVAFTEDWTADAGRRDFTINAIYCDRHGVLLDPLGGLKDLRRRRVRFVGEACLLWPWAAGPGGPCRLCGAEGGAEAAVGRAGPGGAAETLRHPAGRGDGARHAGGRAFGHVVAAPGQSCPLYPHDAAG